MLFLFPELVTLGGNMYGEISLAWGLMDKGSLISLHETKEICVAMVDYLNNSLAGHINNADLSCQVSIK